MDAAVVTRPHWILLGGFYPLPHPFASLLEWSQPATAKEPLILRFVILGLFAAVQIGSADPRIGNWTLESAQCKLTPPNRLSITRRGDSERVVISGEKHVAFTASASGKQTAVAGNPLFDQIELRRINRRHVVVTEKKDGLVVATLDDQLSKDGKELTIATRSQGDGDANLGGQNDGVTVWKRSAGARRLRDPFAGEWTEQMSRTLMRQGMVLKIESDGRGGVQFSSGFRYDARLDGRQYDLQNSRNDTVQLSLVNARTVDEIYRRDGQATEKARYIVSADGRRMTMTDEGTLPTGQHLAETLVFRKQ